MKTGFLSREVTEVMRGFAIISVIICHSAGGGYFIRYVTPLGGIGVAMFLILSGYGINESFKRKGLKDYWINKAKRILIPYALWSLLYLGVAFAMGREDNFPLRYWYLEWLFVWYVLFFVAKMILPNKKSEYAMLVCTPLLFLALPCLYAEQALSFITGVLISSNKEVLSSKISNKRCLTIGIVLFLFATIFLAIKQLPTVREYGEDSLLMKVVQLGIKLPYALSLIAILQVVYSNSKFFKVLEYFGTISLELYLVQMLFYSDINNTFSNLVIYSLIVASLALVLYFLTKKMTMLINNKQI